MALVLAFAYRKEVQGYMTHVAVHICLSQVTHTLNPTTSHSVW